MAEIATIYADNAASVCISITLVYESKYAVPKVVTTLVEDCSKTSTSERPGGPGPYQQGLHPLSDLSENEFKITTWVAAGDMEPAHPEM